MPMKDHTTGLTTAFKRAIPTILKTRRLSFISIHYLYIIGVTLVASVILYGIGGMSYIDALFFASGASTQSGLNTVDVNTIYWGQQFVVYVQAMICNPIFIHSFVVFVRLYWFEKSFQSVVKDARALRRTKSKGRVNTEDPDDLEKQPLPHGIRGRQISVVPQSGYLAEDEKHKMVDNEQSAASSSTKRNGSNSGESSDEAQAERLRSRRGGADLTLTESPDEIRLPLQLTRDQHIAFLEKQRNPTDEETLHIPSPRGFDEGEAVRNVRQDRDEVHEPGGLRRANTGPMPTTDRFHSIDYNAPPHTAAPVSNHITINEPSLLRREKVATAPNVATYGSRNQSSEREPRMLSRDRGRRGTFDSIRRSNTQEIKATMPYISFEPTVARNSMFVNLTEQQREELGGIEYRALKTLALVLICYYICFHILGTICLVPWILHTSYGQIITQVAGTGRPWWGIFTAGSAFNDLGFTLTADSMISFQGAIFPLLIMTFLIIIGNTGFPCMLRFVIWTCSKFTIPGTGLWEEFQFLLDHPRRCFTLLFPRAATWWLFAILVVLNGLDLIFFIILDLNDETILALSPGNRFLDGLFQAASTRTAGFAVVNIANLHPAIQVSYLIMMYISVFPIAISMRRTNVYEERSLGIYASADERAEDGSEPSYVGAHLRRQLSFDLWYVFLGLFIIAIVEGGRIENNKADDYAFTLFSVLFEIVSAYGTVGLSLGFPNTNASFSAQFKVLSKLVIIAMQIRGRHRGLPYELDRAVLLPSESLHDKEKMEGERILQRRRSSLGGLSMRSGAFNSSQNNVSLDGAGAGGLSTAFTLNPTMDSGVNGDGIPGAGLRNRDRVGTDLSKMSTTQDRQGTDLTKNTTNQSSSGTGRHIQFGNAAEPIASSTQSQTQSQPRDSDQIQSQSQGSGQRDPATEDPKYYGSTAHPAPSPQEHKSHARSGLGNAMFKLAKIPSVEEHTSTSTSKSKSDGD